MRRDNYILFYLNFVSRHFFFIFNKIIIKILINYIIIINIINLKKFYFLLFQFFQ